MSQRRHANVVHFSEIEPRTMASPRKFGATMRSLGLATGAQKIGCTHYEVEPGRAAFPRHFHCANEESIYVLEGEAMLEIGEARVPVSAGDYATFPIGADSAHKLDALLTRHGLTVVGGTDLYRFLRTEQAPVIFRALGQRGILVRAFDEDATALRFGLPAGDAEFERLADALARAC